MKQPLVSIITVCYNSEKTIKDTIESVLNQTYRNIEYILVDGASKDSTVEIIKSYEDKFKEKGIIYKWISEPDRGIYDAMNKGWEIAKSNSHIIYLGSGDFIKNMPKNSDIKKYDIIFGDVDTGFGRIFKSKKDFRLRLGNTIHHQALLVRKSIQKDPPFDIKYKIYADFDFNQRLLIKKFKFKYSSEFHSYALPEGFSSKLNILEMNEISRKNFGRIIGLLSFFYLNYQNFKSYLKGEK